MTSLYIITCVIYSFNLLRQYIPIVRIIPAKIFQILAYKFIKNLYILKINKILVYILINPAMEINLPL